MGYPHREAGEPLRKECVYIKDAMTPFERTCTTDEARALYTRIQKRFREQNAWRNEYALGLAPVRVRSAEPGSSAYY